MKRDRRHAVGIVERNWRKNTRIERTRTLERLKLADRRPAESAAMTVPIPPPPSLRKIGLERAETNLAADQTVSLPAKTLVLLFGEELLAALRDHGKPPTP